MRLKPILFNTDMVRAILDGRKTVTRRKIDVDISNQFDVESDGKTVIAYIDQETGDSYEPTKVCRYHPGDILYVREAFCALPVTQAGHFRMHDIYYYKADGDLRPDGWKGNWKPSIHMPREAARIFLKVKNVRVERLQDITTEQARAEGCDGRCECPSSGSYGSLSCKTRDFSIEKFETVWDSNIKKSDLDRYGWYANPWVCVIEFERCEKPEGWCSNE